MSRDTPRSATRFREPLVPPTGGLRAAVDTRDSAFRSGPLLSPRDIDDVPPPERRSALAPSLLFTLTRSIYLVPRHTFCSFAQVFRAQSAHVKTWGRGNIPLNESDTCRGCEDVTPSQKLHVKRNGWVRVTNGKASQYGFTQGDTTAPLVSPVAGAGASSPWNKAASRPLDTRPSLSSCFTEGVIKKLTDTAACPCTALSNVFIQCRVLLFTCAILPSDTVRLLTFRRFFKTGVGAPGNAGPPAPAGTATPPGGLAVVMDTKGAFSGTFECASCFGDGTVVIAVISFCHRLLDGRPDFVTRGGLTPFTCWRFFLRF